MSVLAFLVRGSDGSVDLDASAAKFNAALLTHCAEREMEQATIADAVDAAFEKYSALERINMPALVTFALNRLNSQPENHKVLELKIQTYVRENSQGEVADDGTQERPDSKFLIGKGKGGGVGLRARVEAAQAAKAAAKAAAKK